MSFERTEYSVSETEGRVQVCVTMETQEEFSTTVLITFTDHSAQGKTTNNLGLITIKQTTKILCHKNWQSDYRLFVCVPAVSAAQVCCDRCMLITLTVSGRQNHLICSFA